MARKYDLISALYDRTSKSVVDNPEVWQRFLTSACRNYRLRFDEQLLVFAQKPEATAVLEIDRWNKDFYRWVNRGATGIAVFEKLGRDNQRLKYYFDISDTHQGELSKPVPLWDMKHEYTEPIIETLESTFGELERKNNLPTAIRYAAQNAVEDNLPDYTRDLLDSVQDSFLEDLDSQNISVQYRELVNHSVAYMVMERLGLDTSAYFDWDDFSNIVNFNTPATLNAVGFATSDIAEMALSEIAKTVLSYEKQNRTFAQPNQPDYNVDRNNPNERSLDNEQHQLHDAGGLLPAQSEITGTTPSDLGDVRPPESQLSGTSPESDVLQSADQLHLDPTLGGNRTESQGDGRTTDQPDRQERGRDRTTEGGEYDVVGTTDKQHSEPSAGNGNGGSDLPVIEGDPSRYRHFDYYYHDAEKNELLKNCPALKEHRIEIASYFDSHPDSKQRGDFLRSFFNHEPYETQLSNGITAGFQAYQNYLHFWRGSQSQPERETYAPWFVVSHHIHGMILMHRWDDNWLPSVNEQMEQLKAQKQGFLYLPQDAIDYVLTRGSGFSEGKLRIYRHFTGNHSTAENITFLKKEYGTGGHSDGIPGTGYFEDHDAKGISIDNYRDDGIKENLLKWPYVEKRIRQLIAADRYLSPKEKEGYGAFLQAEKDRAKRQEILHTYMDVIRDYNDFMSASEEPDKQLNIYELGQYENAILFGHKFLHSNNDNIALVEIRRSLETIIGENTHLTGRCEDVLEQLKGEVMRPFEPTEEEAKLKPPPVIEYRYTLGATVHLGIDEYEILSFDDDRVMLYDTNFPLFNKEMSREEFDRKVAENPMNDHLKVEVVPSVPDAAESDHEIEVLSDVITALKLDDITFSYDANGLVATDQDNYTWHGQEFYQFLVEETFVFKDNGGVLGISDELLKDFTELSEHNGVQVKDNRVKQPYRGYLEVKAEYPDTFVFYQVGDFFEAYNDDAQKAADIFDLFVTSRPIRDNERVPMFGIPKHALETYMTMLTDRGYDVAIASLENGERKVYTLASQNKEDPVESKPIGRIEYLHTDGRVRESIEYTSPYQFEKDIKEENHFGIPMKVTLYADEYGAVIPHDYIYRLDPPLHGTSVILSPYLERLKPPIDIAKELIDEYCRAEFERDEGADYTNLSKVNVAYTTTEDGKHEIQANVNLVDFKIETLVDGKVVRSEQYDSLENLTKRGLKNLSFDDLVYVSEDELAPFYEQADDFSDIDPSAIREALAQNGIVDGQVVDAEKLQNSTFITEVMSDVEQLTTEPTLSPPIWEQKRKSRVQSYDLHPDIPMADRHNFDLAHHQIEEVNKKERFHRNYAAIKVLKDCQRENRFATPDEQIILSKYVGWGGIPEAFDRGAGSWQTEYGMLKSILTPEEYSSARESTLTAFYTPPAVIRAVYQTMERLGFREGNILEPSCGIGHFIGMLPDSMKESKVYGVELDTISAGIAQQLYQISSIVPMGYEETNLPDSFFDAVVGNVPFGDFKVLDKRYDKHKFLIHDYFFAKSLDKLRPGGVMALITSKGTMDKESSAVRKYIAQRADLLGAIRLPNNTFKGNAGTEVVSDILILQKRDRMMDLEPNWVHLDTDEKGITMNSYFVQHPEMVLGEMKMVSGRFGPEPSCLPYENANLTDQLEEAITNIHGQITGYEVTEELAEEDASIPADPTVRNFSFTLVDNGIYFRENSRMTPVNATATAQSRIKGLIAIRDSVRRLIDLQTEDYPDSDIKAEQEQLNRLYDAFSDKYGSINSRANKSAFSDDSSYSLLSALEILGDDGQVIGKADMFTKRTIKPHIPITSVDTSTEALAVSMGEKARIDIDYMMELSGKTEEEIYADLQGVIFLNPLYGYGNDTEPKYLMADEYLSGNVREKLVVAKKTAELYPEDYAIHVEALEKVQPKDLNASEIAVRLGATWVPPDIVKQFIFEFMDTPIYAQYRMKVHYSQHSGQWSVEGKSQDRGNVKATSTYGTSRINAYKIIEETLNLKDVRIFDYVEDDNGKRKAVLNAKETAIACAKQELIKQGFADWIWSDPARREKLCKMYNEKFNCIRPREYDGSHITFNGMNPEINLREHQRNAVAHILYGGNTLLAHAVGAGKTFEMTAAAMESKRLGLCHKSLFVVPNHLTEQWASEFLQLYPSANILVATKRDFETKNRKRFCGRIATGDYDAIIIGHSQFEKIPVSVDRQRAILEQQLGDIMEGIKELKASGNDNFSVKQLERTRKNLTQKLEKLNDQSRKDDVVTFEELGVDRLFIDESHYYKNLFLYTKMRNVGGIAQTEAQKSSDLFMKCRYLDELTGGRGVVFATGTPISNSMVELYTIQRYLQYNTLARNHLEHFDSWASTFGETITAVELTPEGTGYRAKTRFARFYNLPELMSMFKEVADIQTADMLHLPVPKANFHNISVKPSPEQKEMVAALAKRAEAVRSGAVDPRVDNMLKITNDGRKLALDQRLVNPLLPDFEGSKLNACVDAIYTTWEKGKAKRSTQLFFCDLSTPKNDGNFCVYDDIRTKLIDRGVPADEIRFIHEADTEAKKLELFKKVRRGDVRVLMGSTAKMGAGTNVQNKLVASHDLDCPWRPSDLEQRLGRSIRQGNENDEVDIYRFVTEETFDAYLYQLVEGKQKFASQIMTSKSPVRSCEDIDETALSYAEIKMLATGNPYIKEKMDLDIQVQKLRLLKSNFLTERYALEDKIIKYYPKEIARQTAVRDGLQADIEYTKQHPKPLGDTFVGMEVKGVFYEEKAEAGTALIEACKQMHSPDAVVIGQYRGFQMSLSFDGFEKQYKVHLKHNLTHTVTLGTDIYGNILRLDNALEGLEKKWERCEQELENLNKQFEIAKVDVEKPFAQEDELKTKTARLNELNALLNVDKRESEMVMDEPDNGDDPPFEKKKERER